jgi:hypothetical protein
MWFSGAVGEKSLSFDSSRIGIYKLTEAEPPYWDNKTVAEVIVDGSTPDWSLPSHFPCSTMAVS